MILTDLSIISRYSRTFFERRLSEFNLGFTEQLIIMYLYKCDSINQDSIAKHFMLDKGSIAKALNKLEEKEFITRVDNPNNKREKLVSITKDGQSKIGQLNNELQEWHNYLFEGLSKEDIENFRIIIGKISENAVKVITNNPDTKSPEEKSSLNQEVKSSLNQEAKSSLNQEAKSSLNQED